MYSDAAVAKELPDQERMWIVKPLKPLRAGTSGFRGKTGVDVTVEHAQVIGARYGRHLRAGGRRHPTVIVGHDQRKGAPELAHEVISGLKHVGVRVVDLGMVSTGLFTYAMKSLRHDGGILITGSHMKHDRIGIIPMNADGTYCTSETTDFIEQGFADFDAVMGGRPIKGGRCSFADEGVMEERYIDHLCEQVDADIIRSAGFRIVFDAGNGTTGPIASRLFAELGVEVVGLFMEPRQVPKRESECVPENCGAAIVLTASKVTPFHAGFALDGDGDRVLVISPTKLALDGDVVAGIFAKWMLGRDDVCVTPVTSGALTAELCKRVGARVEYCRVGQPDTGRATGQFNANFYHEAASNKFGFSEFSLGYDALYSILKMLEIMARRNMSLDELVAELPILHRKDAKVEFGGLDPEFCRKAVADAMHTAKFAFGSVMGDGEREIIDLDGLRINFPKGFWVLLRPSGTEPLARVYAGGEDLALVERLVDTAVEIFRHSLGLTE